MFRASTLNAERPRDVGPIQAASILYGDWGTSKIYVVGLAFALAGYTSFWLLVGVCILNILVGLGYISICKYYPNGGGVYASVRHRSKVVALVGGFFLIADYIVTAALSALAAFSYMGVAQPELWAIGSIFLVGALNFLGPRHTGNLAFLISGTAVISVILLGLLSIPHLSQAVHNIKPLQGGWTDWAAFVSVIIGLSGIEAIANTTGVMRLDRGSSRDRPSVIKTAKPAILWVMGEVCLFTLLFGLAVNALPGLEITGTEVSAPGYPNVRDAMLRYMAETFATPFVGEGMALAFGYGISIVFAALLLSAVNTALVGLSSLLFVMSHDGQFPKNFQKMNSFGVPKIPLLFALLSPAVVLLSISDMTGLANLYAIGFIGAIATNLGSTSTDKKLPLLRRERFFMFLIFLVMLAIEITLFIDKPEARTFVISILAGGLLLRALVMEQKEKKHDPAKAASAADITKWLLLQPNEMMASKVHVYTYAPENEQLHKGAILCPVAGIGKSLEFAIRESERSNRHLYILFIREQKVVGVPEIVQDWLDDGTACKIFDHIQDHAQAKNCTFFYAVSASPADTIVTYANQLKAATIIMGLSRKSKIVQFIRGDVITAVREQTPQEIDLIVVS